MELIHLHRKAGSCLAATARNLFSTSNQLSIIQQHPADLVDKRHRRFKASKPFGSIRLEDLSVENIAKNELFSKNSSLPPSRKSQIQLDYKPRTALLKPRRSLLKTIKSLSPVKKLDQGKRSPLQVAQSKPIDELILPVDVNSSLSNGYGHKRLDCVNPAPAAFVKSIGPLLHTLFQNPLIRELAAHNYLSGRLFQKVADSFQAYCLKNAYLDEELRLIFDDINEQNHSPDLLFPYFMSHARQIYPHIDSMKELKKISDMTQPHNWFPEARAIHRRVIFHAGPTNSGKTYEALEALKQAKSGVYCAPLRLLAAEIFTKLNQSGVACDLVTGEDRQYAQDFENPANHLSSTVEMLSQRMVKDCTVIDEIQMVRDEERGWAFTRALLAAASPQVHLCGEEAAIDIVQRLLDPIGEHVEVKRYTRKTILTVSQYGLRSLKDVQDGDCLVCFGKYTVVELAKKIKRLTGREVAVIYGDMPPAAKKIQTEKFNNPEDKCKVMVATDAIGMGINLNIKRIVFAALKRINIDQNYIPNYFARQISGRAGRYGLTHEKGFTMALIDHHTKLRNHDILRTIMLEKIEDIQKAGISPKWEEIEMFSFLLPNCTFVQLLDIFVSVSETSKNFFVCLPDNMRFLAEAIAHVPLELQDKWTFCHIPIRGRDAVLLTNFIQICQKYADNQVISYEFLHSLIANLLNYVPGLVGLNNLSIAHDTVGIYLWLSYRFPGYFPDVNSARKLENEIDELFQKRMDDCFGAKNA